MSTYEKTSLVINVAVGVLAFVALVVYYRQLRVMSGQLTAMRESSVAGSTISLVAFLQAPEVREARRVVRALDGKTLSEWTDDEKASASQVAANYDVAAALIQAGLAPVDLIASNWGPSITHCHTILEPFIQEQRQRPGGHLNYWTNFDWLSSQASSDQT